LSEEGPFDDVSLMISITVFAVYITSFIAGLALSGHIA
jgi:hypothetical protein